MKPKFTRRENSDIEHHESSNDKIQQQILQSTNGTPLVALTGDQSLYLHVTGQERAQLSVRAAGRGWCAHSWSPRGRPLRADTQYALRSRVPVAQQGARDNRGAARRRIGGTTWSIYQLVEINLTETLGLRIKIYSTYAIFFQNETSCFSCKLK